MSFSSSREGFAFVESFANFEQSGSGAARTFRLDRMETLLKAFGNPERAFKSIHIAGSKGKGSTSAFLASLLAEGGYRTGLYTSPHVTTYKERITLAGKEYPEELYTLWLNRLAEGIEKIELPGEEEPTTFELLTLLAFLIFRDTGAEWAVIETGLGGRLDATNLVTPQACLFTPIELEHTEILGNTLTQIAGEKTGIIKRNCPVFSSPQPGEVREVMIKKSLEKESPLVFLDQSGYSVESDLSIEGTAVTVKRDKRETVSARLSMLGKFQAENAALSLLVLDNLASRGIIRELSAGTLAKGLSETRLPGRMEILSRNPPVLLDGAHTPVSASLVKQTFTGLFPGKRILLFGSVAGKDHAAMASILSPSFEEIIVTTPGSFKRSEPETVYRSFKALKPAARFIPNPKEALEEALQLSRGSLPILITGSFYLAGEIRLRFLEMKKG